MQLGKPTKVAYSINTFLFIVDTAEYDSKLGHDKSINVTVAGAETGALSAPENHDDDTDWYSGVSEPKWFVKKKVDIFQYLLESLCMSNGQPRRELCVKFHIWLKYLKPV